jgi:hippurate hydrolase
LPQSSAELNTRIKQLLPELVTLRRDLHAHPELGFEEERTSKIVYDLLASIPGMTVQQGIGKTGVCAVLGREKQGPCIALRADMDALPIYEETGKPYSSKFAGKMHACGHDGHTSALIGAARILSEIQGELPGPVKFIFQPAEEALGGGRRMCEEGVLEDPHVDAIFGLHCWPILGIGKAAVCPGPAMASSNPLRIRIRGRGTHAALPHLGCDPVLAAAQVIVALQSVVSRTLSPLDAGVVTIAMIEAGTAPNVIPEEVSLKGTVRALDDRVRDKMFDRIREIVSHTAAAYGAVATLDLNENYPVLVNDSSSTEFVASALTSVFGPENVDAQAKPILGAEDFAFYLKNVPGAFWFLGMIPKEQTEMPICHHPQFDFNDDVMPLAIAAHCAIVRQFAGGYEKISSARKC